MLTIKQEPSIAEERIEEPAKRWRNWVVVTTAFLSREAGRVREVGEHIPCEKVHPSKDIAEQSALDYRPKPDSANGKGYLAWLGAFPVSDQ